MHHSYNPLTHTIPSLSKLERAASSGLIFSREREREIDREIQQLKVKECSKRVRKISGMNTQGPLGALSSTCAGIGMEAASRDIGRLVVGALTMDGDMNKDKGKDKDIDKDKDGGLKDYKDGESDGDEYADGDWDDGNGFGAEGEGETEKEREGKREGKREGELIGITAAGAVVETVAIAKVISDSDCWAVCSLNLVAPLNSATSLQHVTSPRVLIIRPHCNTFLSIPLYCIQQILHNTRVSQRK